MRGDITGSMPIALFLTCIEPNLGILCVSIPMLRPIYTRYRSKYSSTFSNSGNKYASNSGGGVRLHSIDRERSSKKNNTDPGVDTLIDQLDKRDHKFQANIHTVEEDTPSIESEDVTAKHPNAQQPRGVIGVHTKWEVEVSRQ